MANIFIEALPGLISFAPGNLPEEIEESTVGRFFIDKYRTGAAERGHAAVAAQLKKQGVPFEVACMILGIRSKQ